MIHREAEGGRLKVEMKTGKLQHTCPGISVSTIGDIAEFGVSGGLAYIPVTFTGLKSHRGYIREIDGKALRQDVHGNDFWQTDYDPTMSLWSRTYNIPAPGQEGALIRLCPEE